MFQQLFDRLRSGNVRRTFALILAGKMIGVALTLLAIKGITAYLFTPAFAEDGAAATVPAYVNPINTMWTLVAAFLVFFMQAGFMALKPMEVFSRWRANAHNSDPAARKAFTALETWANDTIPFPAAAYVTYIEELYQQNRLVRGEHYVRGELVDLARIDCPHLSIIADKDGVCPEASTTALGKHTRSTVKDVLVVPGGHVGAVTGPRAERELYPKLVAWLGQHATLAGARAPESRL